MVLELYIRTDNILSSQRKNCNLRYFQMFDLRIELYHTTGQYLII